MQQELITRAPIPPPAIIDRAPATMHETFIAMARDNSIDVARLAGLMEIQIKVEDRHAEREFLAAMTRLQPDLPRISKKGVIDLGGTRGKIKFARYEDIDAAIRPLLNREGFSIGFGTAAYDKGITITATLSHHEGHSRSESMPLPYDEGPGRNKIQAVGSTISYGRRYLVCAMLNIVTEGEDTDGNADRYIGQRDANIILDRFIALGMDGASQVKFLEFLKAKTVEDIRQGQLGLALFQLDAKQRQNNRKAN